MKNFQYHQALSVEEAVHLASQGAKPMAGGQDLLTELKDYLTEAERVVNLKTIPGLNKIYVDSKGLRLGALVKLREVEEHPEIRQHFPALAEAAASVGSAQIRNLATVGGNLCQRPRCYYYRDEQLVCLKKGGFTCYAAASQGENKFNAILGGGPSYIVHPSDLATALVCLDAQIVIHGTAGPRTVKAEEFFILPIQGGILKENVLALGELVTEIIVPTSALAARSHYLKFRERDSLDFAVCAVAMGVELKNGQVVRSRIVLGGVAPIPWRATAAEKACQGQNFAAAIEAAAVASTQGAKTLSKNGYKIPLTQALVKRAAQALLRGTHG